MIRTLEWRAANGDVILFGGGPFLLQAFYPGNASGEAETSRAVRADGQATFHVTLEPLTPSMTGAISVSGQSAADTQTALDHYRRRLQAALSPKHFGTLVFNNYSGSFKLRCRPITGAVFGPRVGGAMPIDIEWISDEPYWTDINERTLDVGILTKRWRFPWAIAPTVFGALVSRGFIENDTFINVYPRLVIAFTERGSVTVGNATTGESVTVTHAT